MRRVTIYTDGGCIGNPGPGGWAAVCVSGDEVQELSGGLQSTTNNRMELLAAIKGLEAIEPPARIDVVTDSVYLRNGITSWIDRWQRNNWRTSSRQPVKNRDLWERLVSAVQRQQAGGRVTWKWTKGHAGDSMNELADFLANQAARSVDDSDPHDSSHAPIEQPSLFSD